LFPAAPTSGGGAGAGGAVAAAPQVAAPLHAAAPPPADTPDILQAAVNQALSDADAKTEAFSIAQNVAAKKLACYADLSRQYPSVLLTQDQRESLTKALGVAGSCFNQADPAWNDSSMRAVEQQISDVIALNTRLAAYQSSAAYNTWITDTTANADARKSLYAAMYTTTASVLTTLQSIVTSSNVATYSNSLQAISDWNNRVSFATSTTAPWDQDLYLPCRAQWFGKTDGQIVTVQYVDVSQTNPSGQSLALFTNTCLPSLTVSTGLGISTVKSSTYAFTPKTNYSQTPPVTTQVIGYASNSVIVPLFVGQMNYAYFQRSIGLHVSGGAGIGSASSGATGDLFIGNAISFFHRALFLTPSAHFTQRQMLLPGYAVGDPQGSLSSVPIINGWKTGFAITVTLPVLQ